MYCLHSLNIFYLSHFLLQFLSEYFCLFLTCFSSFPYFGRSPDGSGFPFQFRFMKASKLLPFCLSSYRQPTITDNFGLSLRSISSTIPNAIVVKASCVGSLIYKLERPLNNNPLRRVLKLPPNKAYGLALQSSYFNYLNQGYLSSWGISPKPPTLAAGQPPEHKKTCSGGTLQLWDFVRHSSALSRIPFGSEKTFFGKTIRKKFSLRP